MGPRSAPAMLIATVVAVVPAMGCRSILGLDSPDHATSDAADADAPMIVGDSSDGCISYSTLVNTCTLTYTAIDIDVTFGASFNTDTGQFTPQVNLPTMDVTTPSGPAVLIAVRSIDVKQIGNFRVTGAKPVIIAVRDTLIIDGTVDLAIGGAGARTCGTGTNGQNDGGGAGGGAGGSFGGKGGAGGKGDSDGALEALGGVALTAVPRPMGPLGGCRGGDGGLGTGTVGPGGAGGGAIAIVAGRIELGTNGLVNAGGGGGHGGDNDNGGGGGGGSGGFVLLESPTTIIAGKLAANGGGGGEGAGSNPGNSGAPATLSTTRARGGSGNATNGGDGGDGGAGANADGLPSIEFLPSGGGGGGGGVGFIAISGTPTILSTAVITPPHTTWPQ